MFVSDSCDSGTPTGRRTCTCLQRRRVDRCSTRTIPTPVIKKKKKAAAKSSGVKMGAPATQRPKISSAKAVAHAALGKRGSVSCGGARIPARRCWSCHRSLSAKYHQATRATHVGPPSVSSSVVRSENDFTTVGVLKSACVYVSVSAIDCFSG